jgi:hypothetical protein
MAAAGKKIHDPQSRCFDLPPSIKLHFLPIIPSWKEEGRNMGGKNIGKGTFVYSLSSQGKP